MRSKKIIYGNWKMNHGPLDAENFLEKLPPEFRALNCLKGIAPQAPLLRFMRKEGLPYQLLTGAQNCSPFDQGAYTGEISPKTLGEMSIHFVLIGHSERRQHFAEKDQTLNEKVKKVLTHGMQAVLCVGETLKEREGNKAFEVVKKQLEIALKDVSGFLETYHSSSLVIAYEPVWAIGTGKVATPDQAQEMHKFIRKELSSLGLKGKEIPIIYGGSVNPENAYDLLTKNDIDGALVGGASLKPDDFTKLCLIANAL